VFRTPSALFRTLAIAEAASWTGLLAGLVLRATLDLDVAVRIGGGVHGFVFLAYGATALVVALNQRWSGGATAVALASAVVPYATVPTERWLHRSGRLGGTWRREQSADPRDRAWHDRALRTLLRHPGVLVGGLALGVTVVFVVLLLVGPPGGRR
jgi:integral membrane protein